VGSPGVVTCGGSLGLSSLVGIPCLRSPRWGPRRGSPGGVRRRVSPGDSPLDGVPWMGPQEKYTWRCSLRVSPVVGPLEGFPWKGPCRRSPEWGSLEGAPGEGSSEGVPSVFPGHNDASVPAYITG
jgi:hypothetical protein